MYICLLNINYIKLQYQLLAVSSINLAVNCTPQLQYLCIILARNDTMCDCALFHCTQIKNVLLFPMYYIAVICVVVISIDIERMDDSIKY